MTDREIKDLKDGVPNYPMPEVQGPEPSLEHLCCECTGSGIMIGNYPCKVCRGTGYVLPVPSDASILMQIELYQASITKSWSQIHGHIDKAYKNRANATYPNERELSLLNARIAKLKDQLSKELQKKKSERNQFDINQIQQSINTLTKWKLPNKNSTQIGY